MLRLPLVAVRIERFEREMRRLWRGNVPTRDNGSPGPDSAGRSTAGVRERGASGVAEPSPLGRTYTGSSAGGSTSAAGLTAAGGTYSSGGGSGVSWPLEPTPLDVPAAERETLAGYFAETGERMLCVCAVQKVGEKVTPIAPRTHGGATPESTAQSYTRDHPTPTLHLSRPTPSPPNLHRRAAAPSGSSPSASTGSSC